MSELSFQGWASVGYVNFLFGLFLAYWARSTGRSGLVWLLFGWLLAPLAGLVMLLMQGRDHARRTSKNRLDESGRPDLLATRKDVI